MPSRKVAVLGAGVAGLATALLLARDGHEVVLVERDPIAESAPMGAFAWERKGIPHFMQPHAFIPRGRMELMEHWGDVYASLIHAGARDADVGRRVPGPAESQDEALQYVAVRRPLIEWAMRKAVLAEPGIEVASGSSVRGIRLEGSRVSGVNVDGRAVPADIVVDAMGRRTPVRTWLEQQGHPMCLPQRSECGVIYYSRYFALRPGCPLPDGPWLLGPRGDLGYMGFSTFPGDNGTLAAVLAVPTGVSELKIFMHERAFQAAIESIPLLMRWTSPDITTPITGVLSMGGLQNTLRVPDESMPAGLIPVADALCHTDPVLAHGLSFALIHAIEAARALRGHADPHDVLAAYMTAVVPALTERYELATSLDDQRLRMWTGDGIDFSHRQSNYALFSVMAAGAVAMVEPEVFRVYVRRMGLLDSTRVLDENPKLQQKIEDRFGELVAQPRPVAGPTRDEMVAIAKAAMEA